MSVEMLDRVYGHHHRDHLNEAARAIGFGRRRQSLAEPLAGGRRRPSAPAQAIEIAGGGRSLSRTRLHSQIPCEQGILQGYSRKGGLERTGVLT